MVPMRDECRQGSRHTGARDHVCRDALSAAEGEKTLHS